jgi:Na+/melibiose symporter-like transporter
MDYLNNKYVIISLILLLLLFINYNTNNTTKEMTGGSVKIGSLYADEDDQHVSSITIHNKEISTVSSIAEFSIISKNIYEIFTFFDITINDKNPFIYMYRYNNIGNLITKYPIYIEKEKRYKKTHYFSNLNLEKGDILKFVVPTSSVIFSQEPIILILAKNGKNAASLLNDKTLEKYKDKIISLLTANIDVQKIYKDGLLVETILNKHLT